MTVWNSSDQVKRPHVWWWYNKGEMIVSLLLAEGYYSILDAIDERYQLLTPRNWFVI